MCTDKGTQKHTHKLNDISDDRALLVGLPHSALLGACLFESSSTTHAYSILLLKHRHRTLRGDLGCAFRKTQPLIKV